jgi:hypothetical protein
MHFTGFEFRSTMVVMKQILLFCALVLALSQSAIAQDASIAATYGDDARTARLSSLISRYRVVLSDVERSRLIERCVNTQGTLKQLLAKVEVSTAERLAVYGNVIDDLVVLRGLIAKKELDASSLELLIVDYQNAQRGFTSATAAYSVAIEDSIAVDCVQDPLSFRASIEGVREARRQSSVAASVFNDLSDANLETTFDTIKARLASEGIR